MRKYFIKILSSVMSEGEVVQAGPPYSLLTDQPDGMFAQMVAETGAEMRDKLMEMAREKHRANNGEIQ